MDPYAAYNASTASVEVLPQRGSHGDHGNQGQRVSSNRSSNNSTYPGNQLTGSYGNIRYSNQSAGYPGGSTQSIVRVSDNHHGNTKPEVPDWRKHVVTLTIVSVFLSAGCSAVGILAYVIAEET